MSVPSSSLPTTTSTGGGTGGGVSLLLRLPTKEEPAPAAVAGAAAAVAVEDSSSIDRVAGAPDTSGSSSWPVSAEAARSGSGPQSEPPEQPPAQPPRPRSIYEGKEQLPFWDAPLLVAVAANLVWPAVLLLLTGWSMLVVLCFRLERWVLTALLRRRHPAEYEGEDDAPVDVGLYWFGLGNHCEKHHSNASSGSGSSRYFDPRKPSVIYVHGFARRTTARRFRETFNWAHNDRAYGLDVNAADAWVAAGWNIGIFYWNELADEEMPQDTESKIWTSNGRTGMRYRTICPKKGTPAFCTPKAPSPSISQQLADVLADVFRGSAAPYRLVGHSLGTQLVVHATTLLMQRQAREDEAATATAAVDGGGRIALPTRIALLDVFGTLGIKAYLGGWPIMAVVQRELVALRRRGIVLEQYQSSLIGRRGLWFRHLTAFIQLDPAHIPWWRLKSRHIAAIYLYFLSFDHSRPSAQARLRKADLRRHQSATITVVHHQKHQHHRGGSRAAGLSRASGGVAGGDDAGTLNLALADLLASSNSSNSSNSTGARAEEEESMVAAAVGKGKVDSLDAEAPRPLSTSSLGGSVTSESSGSGSSDIGSSVSGGGGSGGGSIADTELGGLPATQGQGKGKGKGRLPLVGKLPRLRAAMTTTAIITRIVARRARFVATLPAAAVSKRKRHRRGRTASRGSSSSSSGSSSGSGSGSVLFSVREETTTQEVMLSSSSTTSCSSSLAVVGKSTMTTMTTTTGRSESITGAGGLCCSVSAAAAAAAELQPSPPLCQHQFLPYTHNKNHLRWLLALPSVAAGSSSSDDGGGSGGNNSSSSSSPYREVEVGEMPRMARATDEEMRGLMECDFIYKQWRGSLFLRVSRAW